MKVFALILCLAVACSAHPAAVVAPAAVYGTGVSSQYRSQDNLGNYAFGYDEGHATGGTFRRESGSNGVKVGSYGLRDADGRIRTVNYVADDFGFRADVQTNEPGVEPKDPAAILVNKSPFAVAAPLAVAPAAPVFARAAAPLAVAHAAVAHAPIVAPAPVFAPAPVVAHAPLVAHAAPYHAHAAPLFAPAARYAYAPGAPLLAPHLARGYSYTTHNGYAAPAVYRHW